MKTTRLILFALVLGLITVANSSVRAQDPVKVASNVYKKVLLDNARVRVIQVEFAPGAEAPWHVHPDHVAYALTDGKIEITDKGKKPFTAEIKAGMAMFLPATTHMAKNNTDQTVKLVVMELKSAKAKKTSAPKK